MSEKNLNDVVRAIESLQGTLAVTNMTLDLIVAHLNSTTEHHFANHLEWKLGRHFGEVNQNLKAITETIHYVADEISGNNKR